MSTDPPETYDVLWISDFFHSFPHINFSFNEVNSTFNPDSDNYKQAVGFWASVPAVFCILLWLVFLIYFIYRCCAKQRKLKQNPSSCPRVMTGLLIFVGVAVVGVGFYGNENAHRGVSDVKHTIVEVNNVLMTASHRVDTLSDLAEDVSVRLSVAMEKAAANITDSATRKKVISLITDIRHDAQEVGGYLDKIQVEEAIHDLDDILDTVEYYRWMVTIVIFCIYIFIFLLSVIGLLLRSKATLITSAVVAVFCSVFIWSATGAYMGSSVALGDLCTDPDTYAINLANPSTVRAAVKAYVKCTDSAQPYQQTIISAQTAVSQAISSLNETVKLAKPYNIPGMETFVLEMSNDLQFAMGNLSTLLNNVGMCTTLHHYYVTGVNSVCTDTISATALLTLVCCLLGIACTVMIFSLSCVWRQYSKQRHRSAYRSVDDTDPFLPRPPPYETDYGAIGQASPRPWSERGTLQQTSVVGTDPVMTLTYQHPLPLDESPPPAYHPGRFVQQYAESAPTPANMRPYSAK